MAKDILEAVLSEANKHDGKRIKTITVEIGEEHFLESESLQLCLEAMAKGTIAEGSRMEIKLMTSTLAHEECAVALELE
jgi:Zn finger protein HypA/HybF involved in hydrogenase expression